MERILGMFVSLDEIEEVLRKLEFEVDRVAEPAPDADAESTFGLSREPGEELLLCTPPWHRLDIRIPADLIEEVARMVGYDKADLTLLEESLPPQRRNEEWETKENIRDILVRAGPSGNHQPHIDYARGTRKTESWRFRRTMWSM